METGDSAGGRSVGDGLGRLGRRRRRRRRRRAGPRQPRLHRRRLQSRRQPEPARRPLREKHPTGQPPLPNLLQYHNINIHRSIKEKNVISLTFSLTFPLNIPLNIP